MSRRNSGLRVQLSTINTTLCSSSSDILLSPDGSLGCAELNTVSETGLPSGDPSGISLWIMPVGQQLAQLIGIIVNLLG